MQNTVDAAFEDIDVVLFVVSARERIGAGDRFIARRVYALGKPVIVAVNKVDNLKPSHIITQMKAAAQLGDFHALHPVSAKTKDGIDELRGDLLHLLPEGQPLFERESATDQTIEQRIAELIREKALQLTRDEVPHSISVEVDELDEKLLRAFVLVETESQKQILVGKKGAMIREIGRVRDRRSRLSSATRSSSSSSSRCGRGGAATMRRSSASASEVRAVDPEGSEWEVSRRWLEVPRWRIGQPDIGRMADADWGTDLDLPGIALWIIFTLALFVLLLVGLPVPRIPGCCSRRDRRARVPRRLPGDPGSSRRGAASANTAARVAALSTVASRSTTSLSRSSAGTTSSNRAAQFATYRASSYSELTLGGRSATGDEAR